MQIYERYGPALLRKAQRVLRSRSEAEDIVQHLFLELLETKNMNVDLPYLYRSVTNRCLSRIRDEKNRARLLAEDGGASFESRRADESVTMTQDLLVKLVAELEEDEGQVLVLYFFDEMSLEEIAEMLGVHRKTVAKRVDSIRTRALSMAGGAS